MSNTLNVYCPEGVKKDIIDEAIARGESPGVYLLRLHDAAKLARANAERVTLLSLAEKDPARTRELILAWLTIGNGSVAKARGDYSRADFVAAVEFLKMGNTISKRWPGASNIIKTPASKVAA